MSKETKKQRFDRISAARRDKILDVIRLLENCANRSNYDYTADDINGIFGEIETALEAASQNSPPTASRSASICSRTHLRQNTHG